MTATPSRADGDGGSSPPSGPFASDRLLSGPPPSDRELWELIPDPDTDPPGGADAWLADMPAEQMHAYLDAAERAGPPDVLPAGVLRRDVGPGMGFASGGVADQLAPGVVLAGFAGDAWRDGPDRLTDDELIGLLRAWRRLSSWAAAGELAAVSELNRRRIAEVKSGADPHLGEHVGDELAIPLTLTARGADMLLELSCALDRLPATRAALAAGHIDRSRAAVIADEVSCLGDTQAAAVEKAVIGRAPAQTTGQLRAAARRSVLAADPSAAGRRREKARKDARVEVWDERSGTASLAGRDLPPADVLAADKRIDALARRLRTSGADGTLDQLRAHVYTALLLGRGLRTPREHAAQSGPVTEPAPPERRGTAPGRPRNPESPGNPDVRNQLGSTQDSDNPNDAEGFGADPQAGLLAGTVNLTMPLATWLGADGAPGEVAGFGPVSATDSRALADLLARRPGARWCVTVTDGNGRAVGHGCAAVGSVRGGRHPGRALTVTIRPLATATCGHERETPGYRPADSLRHVINIRHGACSFPGCRRPAGCCDLDHTVPYDQSGRTCECDLAPLCRRHHRAKQTSGWRLDQPEPGILVWTLPSGRTSTVRPTIYPE